MALTKRKTGEIERSSIIAAILDANHDLVLDIISEQPEAINTEHAPTQMNAAMLAAYGRLKSIFDTLIHLGGSHLRFDHTDIDGDDLQEIAFSTLDPGIIDAVQNAYEKHAPHIINNWPEP